MKLFEVLKRISFAAVAMTTLIFSSCKPEEKFEEASVAVTPSGIELNYYAQETDEVTVKSSGVWTLEGDYAWITPSTVSGKNGAKVTFSANANTTGKTRTASYIFKVSGAEAKLIIKQTSGEIEMNLGLAVVSSGDENVTLTLGVESEDIAFFKKWGIRYSLTDDKEDGEDFEIEGNPAEGDKEVNVTGLETDRKYYFWGYVEDMEGTRFYTDQPVTKSTGNLLEVPVTFSAGAYTLYANIDYEHIDAVEIGICWSDTENPDIDDNIAKIENPESGDILINSMISGTRLEKERQYYVRAYTKDQAGKVSYTTAEQVTTLADPMSNWVNTDTEVTNKFNSLCEYGPSWNGESDYDQYVVECASDAQTLVRTVWENAFMSYTSYHYSYSSLMFREIDGKKYMYHQIYREGSPDEGLAKEANFIGGLVYEMEYDADENMKFTFVGLQHMSTSNWVCDRQDVVKNEMYQLYNSKAGNKDEILQVQKFYEDHTFFVDYGPAIEYNETPYRELRFYAADDLSIVFNYHQRIIGFKNYDFKTYAVDEAGEGSGDIGGGDVTDSSVEAPSAYADMRNNSVAITWSDNNSVNNLSALTMETLFRWDDFNPEEGIDTMFGIEGSWLVRSFNNFHWIPADGWFVGAQGGEFCFAPFERESGVVTDWNGMTQDVWHHLAVTYDSTTGAVAVYIDGQVVSSDTYQLGLVNLYNPDLDFPTFHIGKSYNEKRWFNGDLAEIRLWSRALSAEEINAEGHFYSVDPETADRLVAYWKLSDGEGTYVQDYSGNGHHGTAEKAMAYSGGSSPTPSLPTDDEGNYLLASASDWEDFVEIVKTDKSACAKFTTDINLGNSQAMVAFEDNLSEAVGLSYNGTIDGDGHTLTIAYVQDVNAAESTMAPVFFAGNATVKNLHVTGTMTTTRERACGFFGMVDQSCTATIENCVSSVEIIQNGRNDDWIDSSGFVGTTAWGSNLIIKDCVFNGKLTATTTAYEWAGYLGWGRGGSSITFENCLVAPSSLNLQSTKDSHTFANYAGDASVTMTNCWYTQTIGEAQGEDGSSLSLEDLSAKLNNNRADGPWVVKNNKVTLAIDTTTGTTNP